MAARNTASPRSFVISSFRQSFWPQLHIIAAARVRSENCSRTHRPMISGRVLVIEPDPGRRRRLKALFESRLHEPAQIVSSAEEAVRAIDRRLPDLVLTSSFLSPDGVRTLTSHLANRPETSHVPVLITPQLEDPLAAPPSPSRFAWRRRSHDDHGLCQPDALLQQLGEYFEIARSARAARDLITPVSIDGGPPDLHLVQNSSHVITPRTGTALVSNPSERRRVARLRQQQLPWLRIARLPWGSAVDLLDVSRTGVLVETTARMTPGTVVDLEFLGKDLATTVPSRILRTDIAHVDRLGVRYRVAAAFTRDLGLIDSAGGPDATLNPTAVGEILARTLGDLATGASPAAMRARFEHEVQRLVPVCTVRIQPAPTRSAALTDSIYFSVPCASGRAVLQATFDRLRPPSGAEFKALKSSAYLAAVLLEFAPFEADRALRSLA